MKLEAYVISLIEGQKRAPHVKKILRVFSGFFCVCSYLHRWIYENLIPKKRLAVPVISVGNIVAGGSGKTPFVHYLAGMLSSKKVAVLSRGYKRKGQGPLVVKLDTPFDKSGDEPKLLKSKLEKSLVIVGKNRVSTGRLALKFKSDVIILDDGLQHHPVHRDIEIITLDAHNLLGGGRFLPYGYLRERPKVLSKADLLVLTGVTSEDHYFEIVKKLRAWTDSPIVSMKRVFPGAEKIREKKVSALCAIACPQRFFDTLQNLGCELVSEMSKPDHEIFSEKELHAFAETSYAKGAKCLVWTEKDAIKWETTPNLLLPLFSLRMELEPQFGEKYLQTLIYGV